MKQMSAGEVKITQLEAVEKELRARISELELEMEDHTPREKQRLILEKSIEICPDSVYWMDEEGKFVYVNAMGCRALGYTFEELMHMHVYDVNPGVTPDRWSQVWQLLKEKEYFTSESVHRRRDGSEFPVEIISTYVNFGGQEYCNGFARNITDRKQAETALYESEKKYYSIYKNSNIAILLTIPNGPILSANDYACRLFGRSEEELCRAGRGGIVDETDSRLPKLLEERKKSGNASGELTFIHADGSKFEGEIFSTVFSDREGIEKTSMIIRDLTEQKIAEKEIKTLNKELERKVQESTKELHERITELERFHDATIDRELRMKELRDEIDRLKRKS